MSADGYLNTMISIHSLVKRETVDVIDKKEKDSDFNPLPRKEGDLRICWTWVRLG